MMMRLALVGVTTLLLAITIVRNSAVNALAELDPTTASTWWSSHPEVEIGQSMVEIAGAARAQKVAPDNSFARMEDAARKSPLAPEPYLVAGVRAQVSGDRRAAERAFLAAEWRDPRSLPAHYFLAEQFLRERDAKRGLKEVVALANLAPGGVARSAPYLAAFARDRANWPEMRALFRANPAIEDAALWQLAGDSGNASALLAVASPRQRQPDSPWLSRLLDTLVRDGSYSKARFLWASASGLRPGSEPLLFDSEFSKPKPPPPFNWTLTSSTVGLAERQPGGRLHAIFYGQEDGVLARQLLVLKPGRYRLTMRLVGDPNGAKALNWTIRCVSAGVPLASAPIDAVASNGLTLDVSPGCPAQAIELSGVSTDLPRQVDVTISELRLIGGSSHG